MSHEARDVAARYLAVVGRRDSTVDELAELLDPGCVVVEHPNLLIPSGRERDREAVLEAFELGRTLLAGQELVVHGLVAEGETVAARVSWRGTLAAGAGELPAGTELSAEITQLVTVRAGRVVRVETFDCYAPPATPR